MGYLAFQMLLCLLLAASLGFIVGWLLRGWIMASSRLRERVRRSEAEHYPIDDIEGIGEGFGRRLREAGVVTTYDLLQACSSASGRNALATRTELDPGALRLWTQMADLMRLPGVRSDYSQLLQAAGVTSVQSLRSLEAADLQRRMASENESQRRSQSVPTVSDVSEWIEFAGQLAVRLRD